MEQHEKLKAEQPKKKIFTTDDEECTFKPPKSKDVPEFKKAWDLNDKKLSEKKQAKPNVVLMPFNLKESNKKAVSMEQL